LISCAVQNNETTRCVNYTGGQLPRAGRYVVWSQVQIAGREIFAPFWFNAE
jgi:hypothetical protein